MGLKNDEAPDSKVFQTSKNWFLGFQLWNLRDELHEQRSCNWRVEHDWEIELLKSLGCVWPMQPVVSFMYWSFLYHIKLTTVPMLAASHPTLGKIILLEFFGCKEKMSGDWKRVMEKKKSGQLWKPPLGPSFHMNPNAESSLVGWTSQPTNSQVARRTWWSKPMRHWQPVVSKWGNGEWLWLIGHGDDLIRFSSVGMAKTWLLKRHRNSIHGISITPTAFTGVWSSTIPPFHLVYQPWQPFEWLLAITGLEQPIIRVIPMS